MRNEQLQLQQYMHKHLIGEYKEKYKIAYVSLIKYLCEKHAKRDKWSKSMIVLMKECLTLESEYMTVRIDDKKNIFFDEKRSRFLKYKFYKFRYFLLTDCLFVVAFNDKKKGKDILEEISELFPKNKKKLERLFNCFYSIDMEIINNEFQGMVDIYEILNNNRQFIEQPPKRIMITANMSAGKSTLLNALAGKKVNKTQNDTCTAKIHYLYNKAGEDGLSYEFDYDLELNATQEILMQDNEDNNTLEIVVGTRFRSLNEINNRICFIDTPGVNSSQNKEHRELTNEFISDKNCELLLYLLNGENIGTDDDIRHLKYVKERYNGEILFVVNKLDRFKKDVDSVQGTLTKVKEDLEKLGYKEPKVYPISAYAAYLAKMMLYEGKLTEDELDDLDFRKRKLSKSEFQYYQYYDVEIPQIDENSELENLLRNSGILSLEKMLY